MPPRHNRYGIGEMPGKNRVGIANKPTQPMSKTLKRLWQYLGRGRVLIVSAITLIIAGNMAALVGPKLSGKAIDAIGIGAGQADLPLVLRYVVMMAVLYMISATLSYVHARIIQVITRNLGQQLRSDVFRRLLSLPVRFFDDNQTGNIISVVSFDIDTLTASFSTDVLQIVTSSVTIIFSLVMMLTILPKLVLVFCITVPLSVFFTHWLTKRVRPLYRKRSRMLGELNGYAEEMMDGQKTIAAYSREDIIVDSFRKRNSKTMKAYGHADAVGSLTGSGVNFINNLSLTLVSVFGALMFLQGQAGLGDISSFVQYSRKFSGPINEAANIIGDLQAAFAAAERVFGLLDQTPEPADAENALTLEQPRGDVALQHVSFGYNPEKTIIKNLSLDAKPGSLIAIVGPTGAGKTTIINLLMRFYDIDQGEIRMSGHSIYNLTRKSLRGAYTMVLQDTWLFHGTIYENIAYGREGVSQEDVEAVARAAGIHGFIRRLPRGYDTVITDNGAGISKGQKQQLTIARAMLMEAKMLILDEATSNVDTQTERRIQKAIRELMKEHTCFVIAHRLSTIRNADNILVVRDGNVVEQGTHETLMADKGFYYKLYHAQFEAG